MTYLKINEREENVFVLTLDNKSRQEIIEACKMLKVSRKQFKKRIKLLRKVMKEQGVL